MSRSKHHAMDHCPWLDPQHRDGSRSPGSSVGGTTYDPDSGQVYKERTVPAIKKQRFNWVYQYKTPTLVKRRRPVNVEGAASLFDMAKGQVARDIQHLTTRHLQGIPASVGKKLWQEVEDRYEVDVASPNHGD